MSIFQKRIASVSKRIDRRMHYPMKSTLDDKHLLERGPVSYLLPVTYTNLQEIDDEKKNNARTLLSTCPI